MKVTHTHRGHCQLCARVVAIDTTTGRIAKHGYEVAQHGRFVGTCPGSEILSLHVARNTADQYIASARKDAAASLAIAAKLRAGSIRPLRVWSGQYIRVPKPTPSWPNRTVEEQVMVLFAEAAPEYQKRGIDLAIQTNERDAELATKYADDLEKWADKITGKVEAYRVEDLEPREWKVGDKVRIGGKSRDGFDAVIEAIEDRPYRTNGWRTGSGTVMAAHARLTRPARAEKRGKPNTLYPEGCVLSEGRAEKVIWEPLRNIKRPKDALSPLAEQLKAAGKL